MAVVALNKALDDFIVSLQFLQNMLSHQEAICSNGNFQQLIECISSVECIHFH
jgi:hypothetical protein